MVSDSTATTLNEDLNRLRIDRQRKRTPRWRWLRRLLAVIVIIAVIGGLISYRQKTAATEVRTTRAELEALSADGLAPVLSASGYVIPRNKIDVSSKIIGRVKELLIERGSKVKAGDVLVRLEDEEYVAQVNQAEANLRAARARLDELKTGSRPQEKASARAKVESAEAQLANARRDLERIEGVVAQGAIAKQEYDRVRTQFEVAEAALTSARKDAELVTIGPRVEQIHAAEAAVGQAEANVEYAKTQLSFTVITAPISGTILDKVADKGELLTNQDFGGTTGAKSSAVSMADLNDLQVEIDLNENQLGKVNEKQACEITLDSVPGKTFKGSVDEIAPQADRQKGTVQIKVRIIAPDPAVRPEMNALVTFLTPVPAAEQGAPRVWISKSAVKQIDKQDVVYIVEGDQVRVQPVKLGDEGTRGLRVLEGLKGGETLVNQPPAGLEPGRRIKVVTT